MIANLTNGKSISINRPTLAAIVAILGIISFAVGWFSSHNVFRYDLLSAAQSVVELKLSNQHLEERVTMLTKIVIDDRLAVYNRLVNIEADVRYTKQDVSEIKLIIIPKR